MAETTIQTQCPSCSTDLQLAPSGVTLQICNNRPERSTYMFRCDGCGTVSHKLLPGWAAGELLLAGCEATAFDVPDEALQAQAQPWAALTDDDLISFGLALEAAANPLGELQ